MDNPGRPGRILAEHREVAAAAWARLTMLALPVALVVATAGFALLWSRQAVRGIGAERIVSATRLFPSEELTLRLRSINRAVLPAPWVLVTDQVPNGIEVPGAREALPVHAVESVRPAAPPPCHLPGFSSVALRFPGAQQSRGSTGWCAHAAGTIPLDRSR